jgi:outer membrane protein assembly factor BamD (BamD/ComL family)
MRKIILVGCLALALLGCGDKAKELFETAQFEELQYNAAHAQQLYQKIVDQYPASTYAVQARERLAALKSP